MAPKKEYREHESDCPLRSTRRSSEKNTNKRQQSLLKAAMDLYSFAGDITGAPEWREISLTEFSQRADCLLDRLAQKWSGMRKDEQATLVVCATILFQLQQSYTLEFGHPPFHRMKDAAARTKQINKPHRTKSKKLKTLAATIAPHDILREFSGGVLVLAARGAH